MKKRKAEFPFYEWMLRHTPRGSIRWTVIERKLKARGCYIRHTVKDKYPRVYRVKLVECSRACELVECGACMHSKPHRMSKVCGRKGAIMYCPFVEDGVVCE